jgi:hypothetical protein
MTMRAFVLEHEGRILAAGGVGDMRPGNYAFSRVEPSARELPGITQALGRWAVRVRLLIREAGDVWADQDPNEPTAPALLTWCGMEEVSPGIWRTKEQEMQEERGAP